MLQGKALLTSSSKWRNEMDNTEFQTFSVHFAEHFPDAARKLLNAGQATIHQWEQTLSSVELRSAKLAVNAIASGDEKRPFNWSDFPAEIRRIANKTMRSRIKQQPPQPFEPKALYSIREQSDFVNECLAAGMTKDEAMGEMNRRFPVDERDSRRVSCLHCLDTGWVDVWHRTSIDSVVRGDDTIKPYRASVACDCAIGHTKWPDRDDAEPVSRYRPEDYCIWKQGDVSFLRDWIAYRKETRLERRQNYEPAFDAYSTHT